MKIGVVSVWRGMKIGVMSVYCDWERYEDRSGVSIL